LEPLPKLAAQTITPIKIMATDITALSARARITGLINIAIETTMVAGTINLDTMGIVTLNTSVTPVTTITTITMATMAAICWAVWYSVG